MNPNAYPLQWPVGRPRWNTGRLRARFKMTPHAITEQLFDELDRLNASDVVVSTNRQPYTRSKAQPDDVGVAVYFKRKGKDLCIPCDKWDRVEDNLHAIGLAIQAIRGMERWGTDDMVDAAFSGYTALPESIITGASYHRSWWQVLGLSKDATMATIKAAYRRLAVEKHPDTMAGSEISMIELNRAYDEAQKARGL